MKSVWEGSIEFGLVDIPVKLYSATEPRTISFKLICGKCHSPIQYKRFCEGCKKEIPWNEVEYGFEVSKGKFKVFTREQIKNLKPAKSDIANVLSFVDLSSIDPIYFQKSYYILPAKNKEKVFFLFMESLRAGAKAGVIQIILKNKEYIAVIRPYRGLMLLTTLLYVSEIKKVENLEIIRERPKISSEELSLARKIIDKYSHKEFDIGKYRDEFAEKLKEIVRGKKLPAAKKKNEPKPEKLIEALKLSAR